MTHGGILPRHALGVRRARLIASRGFPLIRGIRAPLNQVPPDFPARVATSGVPLPSLRSAPDRNFHTRGQHDTSPLKRRSFVASMFRKMHPVIQSMIGHALGNPFVSGIFRLPDLRRASTLR